jgi:hypothetical protein
MGHFKNYAQEKLQMVDWPPNLDQVTLDMLADDGGLMQTGMGR